MVVKLEVFKQNVFEYSPMEELGFWVIVGDFSSSQGLRPRCLDIVETSIRQKCPVGYY